MKAEVAIWQEFERELGLPSAIKVRPVVKRRDDGDWQPRDIELIRAAQAGDKSAATSLLKSYEGFIRSTSRRYLRKKPWLWDDILQIAREGFLYALIVKYDPDAGCELTTYSDHWIRHYIGRHIDNQERTIRVSTATLNAVRYAMKRGAETAEEAANMFPRMRGIKDAWAVRHPAPSMDAGPQNHSGLPFTLHDSAADHTTEPPDLTVERGQLARLVRGALVVLTPVERKVIERRYLGKGNAADGEDTLRDIGATYNVGRQRARQIEVGALRKLEKVLRKNPDVRPML